MKITYHFTKEDYFAFQRYYVTHPPGLFAWLTGIAFILLFTYVFSDFLSNLMKMYGFLDRLIWFVVCFIALLMSPLAFYQVYRIIKKNSPETFGEQQLELSEKGLRVTNAISSYTRNWGSIYEFKESTHYMLFVRKSTAFVIPKRDLSVEEMGDSKNW